MDAWWAWLFRSSIGNDEAPQTAREELRTLRVQRRELINYLCTLRSYGFDTLAMDDEATLKSLDKKIQALQLKSGKEDSSDFEPVDHP